VCELLTKTVLRLVIKSQSKMYRKLYKIIYEEVYFLDLRYKHECTKKMSFFPLDNGKSEPQNSTMSSLKAQQEKMYILLLYFRVFTAEQAALSLAMELFCWMYGYSLKKCCICATVGLLKIIKILVIIHRLIFSQNFFAVYMIDHAIIPDKWSPLWLLQSLAILSYILASCSNIF